LADVAFVDPSGIELLKELRMRRVVLLHPSSLVAEQLRDAGSGDGIRKDRPRDGDSRS
jgi:hypothetical protein